MISTIWKVLGLIRSRSTDRPRREMGAVTRQLPNSPSPSPGLNARSFWLLWVAMNTLGYAAWWSTLLTVGHSAVWSSQWILAGIFVGVMQWAVLRHRLSEVGWWVPATIVGYGIVEFVQRVAFESGGPVSSSIGLWGVAGGVVGVCQWIVLRRQVSKAVLWVVASVFAHVASEVLLNAWVPQTYGGGELLRIASPGLLMGILIGMTTSFALFMLLRQPGPLQLHTVVNNRWLATLLGIFPVPIGLGYVYVGRPERFLGALILAIFVAAPIGLVLGFVCAFGGCPPAAVVIWAFAPNLGLSLVFALDSWRIAGDQSHREP